MSHQQYPSLSLEHTSAAEFDSTAGSANIKAYELKGFMFSILTMCPCCVGLGREAEGLIEDLLS